MHRQTKHNNTTTCITQNNWNKIVMDYLTKTEENKVCMTPQPSTSQHATIRLGLCCINSEMRKRKPPVFSSRTVRLQTFNDKGVDHVKTLCIQNLKDTLQIMEENDRLGIKVFRLSSEIFPHCTNPKCEGYSIDFANDLLVEIGELARKLNQRLTCHPGQFNVMSSPSKTVVANTVREMNWHADMFDRMGMNQDSVMVLHGGGVYGDKQAAKDRWIENFALLSPSAQKRLVLENCEKCYNIQDCLDISKGIEDKYGFPVPVVLDSHHYDCYNILHPSEVPPNLDVLIPFIIDTWKKRDIRMKVHISEQGEGKCGHHSDFVEVIPEYFLDVANKYNTPIDMMIEAKAKQEATLHLMNKYNL